VRSAAQRRKPSKTATLKTTPTTLPRPLGRLSCRQARELSGSVVGLSTGGGTLDITRLVGIDVKVATASDAAGTPSTSSSGSAGQPPVARIRSLYAERLSLSSGRPPHGAQ
jgi:hypothetical protein